VQRREEDYESDNHTKKKKIFGLKKRKVSEREEEGKREGGNFLTSEGVPDGSPLMTGV